MKKNKDILIRFSKILVVSFLFSVVLIISLKPFLGVQESCLDTEISLRRVRAVGDISIGIANRISTAIGTYAQQLRKALLPGDKNAVDAANAIIDEINAYKGDLNKLSVGEIKNLAEFKNSPAYLQYKKAITDLVLGGKYVAEIFAAGAASRFGAGPFYGLDFWKTAEKFREQRAGTLGLMNKYLKGEVKLGDITDEQKKELYVTLSALTPEEQKPIAEFLLANGILKIIEEKGEKKKENLDALAKVDRLNILFSSSDLLREVINRIEMAKSIDVFEDGIRGVGLGARQLIELKVELSRLAKENGSNTQNALAKQTVVLHINSEMEGEVKTDLVKHNFYGFNSENIIIIVQPVLPGFNIAASGDITERQGSDKFPGGHGHTTEQLGHKGTAYTLNSNGQEIKLSDSVLEQLVKKGAQIMGTWRINDLTFYVRGKRIDNGTELSALNIDKLAFSLYQIKAQNSNVVVELVDNPEGQKGGLFLRDAATGKQFLLEGINAATKPVKDKLTELTAQVQKQGEKGIPYNAFRLTYNLNALANLLTQQLPNTIRLRGRTNSLYLELVTGDITYFDGANSTGMQNKGELIQDFKAPLNLQLGIEYIRHQDSDPEFREAAQEYTAP